ncbi:hypothetical protein ACWDRB_41660 [Nonomuraea sp. NPDC003707]
MGSSVRLSAESQVALDREEAQQGRLRRYHRLTDDGAEALRAEACACRKVHPCSSSGM